MDQSLLVKKGQTLVQLLDDTAAKPRFAMWINVSDESRWRLWIVPAKGVNDKRDFYLTVAETMSKHRDELPDLDIGQVEFTRDTKPVVQALNQSIHMPGIGSTDVSGSLFGNFFVSDGILIRANL